MYAENQDDKTWGMFPHLSALLGLLVAYGTFIGPLVIFLVKKDQSAFAAQEAKEALNFQITMLILIIIGTILIFVCIGIPFLIALAIIDIVLPIVAGITASNGTPYRYPFCLRLIK